MAGRVVRFPLPGAGGRGVMEPLDMEWVGTGWRTLPSGVVIKSHGEKRVVVNPHGEWMLTVRHHGEEGWAHISGGPDFRLIDYFARMAGMQFKEEPPLRGERSYAFGVVLGIILTLL